MWVTIVLYVCAFHGSSRGFSAWTWWCTMWYMDLSGFWKLVETISVDALGIWGILGHILHYVRWWNALSVFVLHLSFYCISLLTFTIPPYPLTTIFLIGRICPLKWFMLFDIQVEAYSSTSIRNESESHLNLCNLSPIIGYLTSWAAWLLQVWSKYFCTSS